MLSDPNAMKSTYIYTYYYTPDQNPFLGVFGPMDSLDRLFGTSPHGVVDTSFTHRPPRG